MLLGPCLASISAYMCLPIQFWGGWCQRLSHFINLVVQCLIHSRYSLGNVKMWNKDFHILCLPKYVYPHGSVLQFFSYRPFNLFFSGPYQPDNLFTTANESVCIFSDLWLLLFPQKVDNWVHCLKFLHWENFPSLLSFLVIAEWDCNAATINFWFILICQANRSLN